ncbi:MAG: DUF4364 family protein [Clostridia bacterium]
MAHFLSGDSKNKVIILYIVETMQDIISRNQLSAVAFDLDLINYFELQQTINDLEANGYIAAVPSKIGQGYGLTEKAREVYPVFVEQIPLSVRANIKKYIGENKESLMSEDMFYTNCLAQPAGGFDVVLRAAERDRVLLSMVINVPTVEYANQAVRNWSKAASAIYKDILDSILDVKQSEPKKEE